MSRFMNPEYLYMIILAVVMAFGLRVYLKKASPLRKHFSSRMMQALTSSISENKRMWKLYLQSLVIIFLLLTLARWQMGEGSQPIHSEGVEIILAVDVSNSMLTEDVQPNRLAQVKNELTKLVDFLPGNKVGVIAFAGGATLLSPLTTDPSALKMFIESLSPDMMSNQGTNFSKVLKEAQEAFERGTSDQTGQSVTRALIIASDGEDQESHYQEEAKKLKDKGVFIFGLAYGTEKGGLIPERDERGFLRGYKKGENNQPVLSQVKGDNLKELAQLGGGSFYYASFGGSHIKNIADDLSKLEKTKFESSQSMQYEERFQIFLIMALLLAFIEWLLSERNHAAKIWRGRFADNQATSKARTL